MAASTRPRKWKGPAHFRKGSEVINVGNDPILKGKKGKITHLIKDFPNLVYVRYGNLGPLLTRIDTIKLA